jgi:hydroxymethylbilane synthase
MTHPIIGTRGSLLARTQSTWVRDQLGCGALKIISTRGDRLVDLPLQSNLEKGLFTKELEVALLEGEVDLAVHSLKDLPVQPPPGLVVNTAPARAPAADLLIWRRGEDLGVKGRRVGSSSARRIAMLEAAFPHLHAVPLRGNVPTRLDKLRRGDADALILAEAGIHRLGLDLNDFDVVRLNPEQWVPAPGQGALGLERRADDQRTAALLDTISDHETHQAVVLERAVLDRFGGGCHAAMGAYATRLEEGWNLTIGARQDDGAFGVVSVQLPDANPNQVGAALDEFRARAVPLSAVTTTPWS